MKVKLTKDIIERAMGRVVQGALRAVHEYEGKPTEELLDIWKEQVWSHIFGCVSARDHIEKAAVEGILLEKRGYTEQQLGVMRSKIIREQKKWEREHLAAQ